VQVGLREQDVDGLTELAMQEAIRTYCWKDLSGRFGNVGMTRNWLEKKGNGVEQMGRGMLQLRHPTSSVQAAYGWVGPEECAFIPESQNTFAERVSEQFAGRGIGTLFATVIVSGATALWGARNIGLETYASNKGAIKVYERAGAEFVTERDSVRRGLDGDDVKDKRRYMRFSRTFDGPVEILNSHSNRNIQVRLK